MCAPRAHCAAAITSLVKEGISHGIFRALEVGAMAGEGGNKSQNFARLTHPQTLRNYFKEVILNGEKAGCTRVCVLAAKWLPECGLCS